MLWLISVDNIYLVWEDRKSTFNKGLKIINNILRMMINKRTGIIRNAVKAKESKNDCSLGQLLGKNIFLKRLIFISPLSLSFSLLLILSFSYSPILFSPPFLSIFLPFSPFLSTLSICLSNWITSWERPKLQISTHKKGVRGCKVGQNRKREERGNKPLILGAREGLNFWQVPW